MVDPFSVSDILLAIFLIVPGFISFNIFKKFALVEKEFAEHEMIIWSTFLSLIIYSIFLARNYFQGNIVASVDELRETVFSWQQLVWIMSLAVAVGVVPGLIIKWKFRQGMRPGELWKYVMTKVRERPTYPRVRVYTDKEIFEGVLLLWAREYTTHDILIVKPKIVTTDAQGHE